VAKKAKQAVVRREYTKADVKETPELQEGRDAFCPPEDASPLRADAPSGPVRRTRHAIVQNLKTLASRIWRPPLTAAIGGHFCE
jgi:hypothetical protein